MSMSATPKASPATRPSTAACALFDGEDQNRHLQDMPYSAFGCLPQAAAAQFQQKYGYLGLRFLFHNGTDCDIMPAGGGQGHIAGPPCWKAGACPPPNASPSATANNDAGMLQWAGARVSVWPTAPPAARSAAARLCGAPPRRRVWPTCAGSCGPPLLCRRKGGGAMEYTRVGPGLPPVHGARAGALILGSFPSPKSREQGLFLRPPAKPLLAAAGGADRRACAPRMAISPPKSASSQKTASPSWDVIRLLLHPRRVGRFHPGCRTKRDPGADRRARRAGGVLQRGRRGAALCALYPARRGACRRAPCPPQARPTRPARRMRCAAPGVRRWPPGCPAGQILKNCKIAPKSCKKRAETLHPAPVCIIMAVYGRFAVAKSRSSDIHSW